MKKRPSLSPGQIILYIVLLLLFILLTFTLFFKGHDQKKFSALTHDLFVSEMTANTLNMHYSLASPENFGIYGYEAILPAYHTGDEAEATASIGETLHALSKLHPGALSDQDAYTYGLLVKKLENSQALNSFPYYQEPLSPSSGVQSQLPVLLAEYTFRSRRDVEDYLALLDQTDEYLASLLAYEQEKAAAGFSQSSYSLRQVKKQCDNIVTKEALDTENHFLQTTFSERLAPLISEQKITEEEAAKYISQNNRLLRTVLQPAYETLADGLFLLEDAEGVPAYPSGLASLPEGRSYYEQLLISNTGSYRSIDQIKALLDESLAEDYANLRTLLQENPDLRSHYAEDGYSGLPLANATEMLRDLQSRMDTSFPTLYPHLPSVTVKSVSPDLQDYSAPAFYLTAPLDASDTNVIYMNQKDSPSGLELYTTLAHEGFPGHLYQTVYNNRRFLKHGENKIRQLLWYGGYLEGWALYVEFLSYDYAADMLQEQDRQEDALCAELEKYNRRILLNLYSHMDIMIHYDNASREELATYLSQFGIENDTAVNSIYNYIADEPCNYLKYYLGYLEILELKKTAVELWGDAYNDYTFHSFYLNAGPSDFSSLHDLLHR
ncbi:MAG: DUF885 domain-containing protein [Lachnospiraceae bacterium]|nr:DUF885 domain-containing protein [Lachnospiraceae bacterium]